MKNVRIFSALGVGWQQFTERPWYLLGVTIALVVLMAITTGDALVTALGYILFGGYIAFLLRHSEGTKMVFDDLFDIVDKRWIYFAFLGAIKGILIMLGLLCFFIPGIYLAVRWMFAELLVIDKGMRPMEALRASSEMTKGVRWKLFLYVVIVMLMVMLGLLFLLVGAIVAGIVAQLATIRLYKDLSAPVTEVVGEPQSGG